MWGSPWGTLALGEENQTLAEGLPPDGFPLHPGSLAWRAGLTWSCWGVWDASRGPRARLAAAVTQRQRPADSRQDPALPEVPRKWLPQPPPPAPPFAGLCGHTVDGVLGGSVKGSP